MERLGRLVVRRSRWILLGALLFVIAAGVLGTGAVARLKDAGFTDPNAQSTVALNTLQHEFDVQDPSLAVLIRARAGSVDAPAVAALGEAVAAQLAREPGVSQVQSYWATRDPALRSRDGREALILAVATGDQTAQSATAKRLMADLHGDRDASVLVGGSAAVNQQVTVQTQADLLKAEAIAVPITLVLLVLAFAGLVAGSLPLAVGGVAIVGTLLVLRVLASVTDVSVYALNLTTALGLGLGIDYALFIVSRFREEVHAGRSTADAVVVSVQTAGRTVLFSAATVAVALAALLVFPEYFLRSFGYAGIAVVALAATAALLVLPALLAVLGPRVDAVALPFARNRTREGTGWWHRIAMTVMRRPIPVATGVILLLLVLATPFLKVAFGLPDDRVLPASATSRQVGDAIRTSFSTSTGAPVYVVAADSGNPTAQAAQIAAYAARLSALPGVGSVQARTGTYAAGHEIAGPTAASARFATSAGTWLEVLTTHDPYSSQSTALVGTIRHLPAPFAVQVTGAAAQEVDTVASITSRLPLAIGLIALVTFVALFLMTGSVVIPVKALLLSALSLSATFGVAVWVFQQGHLSGLLGFTPTGTLTISMLVLMFCLAFGLSMDYEVFLLSRIKEEHDRTGDTTSAVAMGLERTGRIVTTAAVLLAIVFLAFGTSHIAFLKLFGIGTAVAVIVDATLIRALLLPAAMRLLGERNWWAPRPMRRLYDRFGFAEAPVPARPEPVRSGLGGPVTVPVVPSPVVPVNEGGAQ